MDLTSSERRKLSPQERLDRFGFKLPDVPQDRLELPVGFIHEGVVISHAVVRPMTGKDRKICASSENQRSAPHMTTSLLMQCVTELSNEAGDKKPKVTLQILRKMTEADRSYLAMTIRRLTYPGQKILVTADCDNNLCQKKIDHWFDFEEFKIIRAKPKWVADEPCFEVHNNQYNMQVVMKYLTGLDSEKIAERFGNIPQRKLNPVEMIQAMATVMTVSINGQEVDEEDFQAFPQDINAILEEAVVENRAGPDLSPVARCPECGQESTVNVSIVDFLLRGRQKKE